MKKISFLIVVLFFPFSVFSQQLVASYEGYGDPFDLHLCSDLRQKKTYVISPEEIYMICVNKEDPKFVGIIRTDQALKQRWEFKLDTKRDYILDELNMDEKNVCFFSMGDKSNDITFHQISREDGKEVFKTTITTTLEEGTSYRFKNVLEKEGIAWYLETSESRSALFNGTNKKDFKVTYKIVTKTDQAVTTGEISIGNKYFAFDDFFLKGDHIYIMGFDIIQKKTKGDYVAYRYNYKTKELKKDIILPRDTEDKDLEIENNDYELTANGYAALFIEKGKTEVYRLIHYNLSKGTTVIYPLQAERTDGSNFSFFKDRDIIALIYLDQKERRLNVCKIQENSGAIIAKGNVLLEEKLGNFPKIRKPHFLEDGKLLVNIERTYISDLNTKVNAPPRKMYTSKELHYFLLSSNFSLLKSGIIEKETYFPEDAGFQNTWLFTGYTSLETPNGICYFYQSAREPVTYTLIGNDGNIVKKDVPITKSFVNLKKDTIIPVTESSFLFFGIKSLFLPNGLLKVEHIKIF